MSSDNKSSIFFIFMYFGLILLYGVVGLNSLGYDDEFFNISAVEKYGSNVISFIQGTDVHPPGSYFLNWAFYSLLGDWSLVRLLIALFSSACLIYGVESVRRRYGNFSGITAFLLLGLNPAILLWCTGIRWYAFFVPIFIWICITPKPVNKWYWIKPFFGLVLLGYIGYIAFIVAPAVLALYWRGNPENPRMKIKNILLFGGFAALAYSNQMIIFVTVHMLNADSQVSSLWRSLLGFAVAQVSNQGVFPISIGGISSVIGFTGLFSFGIWRSIKQIQKNEFFLPYWIGVAGIIASGIAGKFRNFVTLSPLQSLWFSSLAVDLEKKRIFVAFLSFAAAGNLFGIYNVFTHQNTTKNSWNLPSKELLKIIGTTKSACVGDLLVLAHDPTLTYLLEKQGFSVFSPYSRSLEVLGDSRRAYQCIAALKTYAGSIDEVAIQRMYLTLEQVNYSKIEKFSIGYDSSFKFKKILDSRYPEYQIELIIFQGVSNFHQFGSWMPENEPDDDALR